MTLKILDFGLLTIFSIHFGEDKIKSVLFGRQLKIKNIKETYKVSGNSNKAAFTINLSKLCYGWNYV